MRLRLREVSSKGRFAHASQHKGPGSVPAVRHHPSWGRVFCESCSPVHKQYQQAHYIVKKGSVPHARLQLA